MYNSDTNRHVLNWYMKLHKIEHVNKGLKQITGAGE